MDELTKIEKTLLRGMILERMERVTNNMTGLEPSHPMRDHQADMLQRLDTLKRKLS